MNKNHNELVSVIIPVYNYEKYLASAIESVLAQTYCPLELIVVDDGSIDGSAAIVQSYQKVRYIHQTNLGVAAARNTGLAAARGNFIAFLDADDTWPVHKLQTQVDYLREHPNVMYTIAKISNEPEEGLNLSPPILQAVTKSNQIGMATIVARKEIFDQIGGFNTNYHVGEDLEWVTRAKDANFQMVILPDILLHRRIHHSNMSLTQPKACNSARLRIAKESIDRLSKKKVKSHGTQ